MLLSWLVPSVLGLAASTVVNAAESTHAQLVKLASTNANGVIQLDSRTFDLVTSPRRNWTATVHLTALDPRRRCAPCKEFDPSFSAVAKSWSKLPAVTRDTHFFATLDFDNGQMVFQSLGLQSAPVVYVYPPTEGEHKIVNPKSPFIKYDFSNGFDPAPLAESLSRHTVVPIPYRDPIDWSKWFTALGSLVPLALMARYVGPALASRWTWAFVTLTTSLIMTSGFMFVRIRGMPRAAPSGDWIASGYQNQYGQEVQVVAGIYGLLGASFLMLTLVAPAQTSPRRQKLQVWAFTIVIFVVFSILISLFRVKSRSYPFKLLI